MRTAFSVGVVGLGASGRALASAFDELPQADLRWICDRDPEVLARLAGLSLRTRVTASLDDLLEDETLDAVAVATPLASRHQIVLRALSAEKHAFVAAPLARRAQQAYELVAVAEALDRRLMVGHLGIFQPAVHKLKELLELGHLGELYYLYANHQTLGELRRDESALWSLGVHEVAVILHLLGDEPVEVFARGESYVQPGVPDVVFCFLKFATGITAHLHLSWLDPNRLRRLTAVGSARMAVVDDADPERKLTLHEKRAAPRRSDRLGDYVEVDVGDIVSPRLATEEPVQAACETFLASLRSSTDGPAGGAQAARVVAVLEALERSLEEAVHPTPMELSRSRVVPLPARRR
jgi:predicted dehydrogenase